VLTAICHGADEQAASAQEFRAPMPGRPAAEFTPEIRAQLVPRQFTTLSSEMAGRIDKINTRLGETFKQGERLVEFDCVVQRAQLARAKAVMTQAEKTLAINRRLLQLRSIGQNEVDIAQAEVEKAQAEHQIAQSQVAKCTIEAPFSGVTVEQKARPYQYATAGQPLLDVLDNTGLDVEVIVPSRWLAWLKSGYPFQLHVDETGKTYPTRVARLGGRVDPVSQSIKVIGEITQAAPDLMAGMSGKVNIAPPK
jgi:RND family efflux transporter MFP subunit